jgi:hypothetical protein
MVGMGEWVIIKESIVADNVERGVLKGDKGKAGGKHQVGVKGKVKGGVKGKGKGVAASHPIPYLPKGKLGRGGGKGFAPAHPTPPKHAPWIRQAGACFHQNCNTTSLSVLTDIIILIMPSNSHHVDV